MTELLADGLPMNLRDEIDQLRAALDNERANAEELRQNCNRVVAKHERLRTAIDELSKALSAPGGPSLAVQRHDPSWAAWKKLCSALHHEQSVTVEE